MLFPISITIDGYIQADSYQEARALAARLELRELIFQDKNTPHDSFGIELEQTEIAGTTVLSDE
jgi:hypothetical protein|nr:MAG TPA: hypothetical protein [Bacteriophage sp.]